MYLSNPARVLANDTPRKITVIKRKLTESAHVNLGKVFINFMILRQY